MGDTFKNTVKTMIKETFDGPPVPVKGSWFTETKPNSGIFGVLHEVSCDNASVPIHGTTLAAHADHIRHFLWGTDEIVKSGQQPKMDWRKSWDIHSVDETQWDQIREELRKEYAIFLESIDTIQWDELQTNEVLASLAHSAYHLGAIRQILKSHKV